MAMPYLSQAAITLSSRMEPPAWAMYSTPLLWARSTLSPKGKKGLAEGFGELPDYAVDDAIQAAEDCPVGAIRIE